MADRFDWESRDRWESDRRDRLAGDDPLRGDASGEIGRDRWSRSGTTGAATARDSYGRPYGGREHSDRGDMRGDRRTHDWEVGDRNYTGQNEAYSRSRWQGARANAYGPNSYGQGSYGQGSGRADWFTSEDYGGGVGAWGGRTGYAGGGAGYSGRGAWRDDDPRGFVDRAVDEVRSWFGDSDAERRREQDHRGRGPSDYTRSDERIREDANDRLTDHPLVDARNITVTVTEGEVTLAGTVGSRMEKRRAEDCVEDIGGVKHVQNNLRVSATEAADNRDSGRESTGWGGGVAPPLV